MSEDDRPVWAVRFQTLAEVTYYVCADTPDQAAEFTPSEWPAEPIQSEYSITYSEWQPPDPIEPNMPGGVTPMDPPYSAARTPQSWYRDVHVMPTMPTADA